MTNRKKAAVMFAALAATAVAAVAGVQLTGSAPAPKGVIGEAVVGNCHTVPGKFWNGRWHYSIAILRPTRIETYCVTYPATGAVRTLVKVSIARVALP